MLELCLHFSSAMNSVCGLRFSIPYLAGQLPCCSPLLLFPFQVRPTSRSYYTGPVLLGFYYYRALDFYPFYRFIAFGPWAPIYRLCYLVFRTFGLCHTLYFECYRYWAFKPCDTILTFIFINGDFINYYLSNCFYYFESDGCHSFGIRAGFRPGSDPGWRFWRLGFIWFYSILTVLDDFKIFSGIWEFLK